MLKKYIINGKITYLQGETSITNFTFTNVETGEMFSLATKDQAEADEITYGAHQSGVRLFYARKGAKERGHNDAGIAAFAGRLGNQGRYILHRINYSAGARTDFCCFRVACRC